MAMRLQLQWASVMPALERTRSIEAGATVAATRNVVAGPSKLAPDFSCNFDYRSSSTTRALIEIKVLLFLYKVSDANILTAQMVRRCCH